MALWHILRVFGIFCDHFEYVNIFWSFEYIFPVLICFARKDLARLLHNERFWREFIWHMQCGFQGNFKVLTCRDVAQINNAAIERAARCYPVKALSNALHKLRW
jgi:hypothetical protein